MRNKFVSTICAGLLAMGMSSVGHAALIAMDFTGATDSINYVFDLQPDFGGQLRFVSADTNDGLFDSSGGYFLELRELETTTQMVVKNIDNILVSFYTFNGTFGYSNGTLDMYYNGDNILHSGTSYTFDAAVDSSGNVDRMFYGVFSIAGMTSVIVGPVSAVPVPAAIWLFGSGLIGLAGIARRRA